MMITVIQNLMNLMNLMNQIKSHIKINQMKLNKKLYDCMIEQIL